MDKKAIVSIVIAAALIGLGTLLFLKKSPQQQRPAAEPAIETQQPIPASSAKTIVVQLSSQNNSGESGTATLMDVGGKISVVLALSGAPSNIVQPAHIHTGPCATIGAVRYPLTFPVNGQSETMLDVALDDLLKQLPLAINVHKSAAESSVYVACGDIVNPNTPAASQPTSNPSSTVNNRTDDRTDGGNFSTPTDRRRGADKPED